MPDQLLHPVHHDHTPWLDRDGPDWVGCFPGLGSVRVGPDGAIGVEVVDGPAPDRERALRQGWGEPLALARCGHHLAPGCTLASGGRAVLVTGRPDEVGRLALGLLAQGWVPLADGLCPLTEAPDRDGRPGWRAHRRPGPLLVRQRLARAAWAEGLPVRGGTEAVALRTSGPAADGSLPLGAVLDVHRCTGAEPVGLRELTGAERLRAAASLLIGGVLAQPADGPGELLRRRLSLAALPAARLAGRGDGAGRATDLALTWLRAAVDDGDGDGDGDGA